MKIILKPNKGPVHFQVATSIRRMIVKDYQQGDLLPSHRELSVILGIGLRSITNAMHLLSSQGIVTPIRKKGTIVARRPSSVEERLSRVALISKIGSGDLFTGYNGQIMSGVSMSLDRLEVGLLMFPRKDSVYTPVEEVLVSGADGLVMLGAVDKEYLNKYSKTNIPIVLVDNHPADISVDSVVCDNFGAAATLINYLFEKGHSNISYATYKFNKIPDSDNVERHEAFLLEMKCHGVEPCRPTCEMNVKRVGVLDDSPDKLIEAIRTGQNAPTVIVTDSDGTAFALMKMFKKEGIRVPEDVSVAAIVQAPDIRTDSVDLLTGCCINFIEMGLRAIDLIVEQCQEQRYAPRVIRVGYKFVNGCSIKEIKR